MIILTNGISKFLFKTAVSDLPLSSLDLITVPLNYCDISTSLLGMEFYLLIYTMYT